MPTGEDIRKPPETWRASVAPGEKKRTVCVWSAVQFRTLRHEAQLLFEEAFDTARLPHDRCLKYSWLPLKNMKSLSLCSSVLALAIVAPVAEAKTPLPTLSITLANGQSSVTTVEGSVIPLRITSSLPAKPLANFTSLKPTIALGGSAKAGTDFRPFITGPVAELTWIPKGKKNSPTFSLIVNRDLLKEGFEEVIIQITRRDTVYRVNPRASFVRVRIRDGAANSSRAATLNVPGHADSIRHGILMASSGDTVSLGARIFKENDLRFAGKKITLRGARSNGTLATTIDAENKACHFLITGGEDRTLVIRDLILTRGSGRGVFNGQLKKNMAGSIHITGSSPTILNNRFVNNSTAFGDVMATDSKGRQSGGMSGGAILVGKDAKLPAGNPLIQGNEFIGNRASANAGAISVLDASAQIEGNIFRDNIANLNGGAVQILSLRDHASTVSGNAFVGNKALGRGPVINSGAGGALSISSGAQQPLGVNLVTTVASNTFRSNYCRFAGGAISIFGADADILDNTIVSNDGGQFGGGVHLETQAKSGGNRIFNVEGNVINSNVCHYIGAGLHNFFEKTATVTMVRSNEFRGNRAIHPDATIATTPDDDPSTGGGTIGLGGAIGSLGGTALVSFVANNISGNQAQQYAAIWCNEHPVAVESNVISDNIGRFRHSAVFLNRNTMVSFRGNTFSGNRVEDANASTNIPILGADRGPLYIADAASAATLISGNTFSNNRGFFAGAIFLLRSPGALISSNTFDQNESLLAKGDDNMLTSSGGTIFTAQQPLQISGNTFRGDRWAIFNQNAVGGISVLNNGFASELFGPYRAPGFGFATTATALNSGVSSNHPSGSFAGNVDLP
jgi:hypothetical protein